MLSSQMAGIKSMPAEAMLSILFENLDKLKSQYTAGEKDHEGSKLILEMLHKYCSEKDLNFHERGEHRRNLRTLFSFALSIAPETAEASDIESELSIVEALYPKQALPSKESAYLYYNNDFLNEFNTSIELLKQIFARAWQPNPELKKQLMYSWLPLVLKTLVIPMLHFPNLSNKENMELLFKLLSKVNPEEKSEDSEDDVHVYYGQLYSKAAQCVLDVVHQDKPIADLENVIHEIDEDIEALSSEGGEAEEERRSLFADPAFIEYSLNVIELILKSSLTLVCKSLQRNAAADGAAACSIIITMLSQLKFFYSAAHEKKFEAAFQSFSHQANNCAPRFSEIFNIMMLQIVGSNAQGLHAENAAWLIPGLGKVLSFIDANKDILRIANIHKLNKSYSELSLFAESIESLPVQGYILIEEYLRSWHDSFRAERFPIFSFLKNKQLMRKSASLKVNADALRVLAVLIGKTNGQLQAWSENTAMSALYSFAQGVIVFSNNDKILKALKAPMFGRSIFSSPAAISKKSSESVSEIIPDSKLFFSAYNLVLQHPQTDAYSKIFNAFYLHFKKLFESDPAFKDAWVYRENFESQYQELMQHGNKRLYQSPSESKEEEAQSNGKRVKMEGEAQNITQDNNPDSESSSSISLNLNLS